MGERISAGALAQALAGKAEPGRPRIMIFLTDGAPTAGELVPDKILEQVKKANTSGTRIFVMGVGNDVNAHLLDKLADLTDGSSEYVAPQEELDAKIAALYDRLSYPGALQRQGVRSESWPPSRSCRRNCRYCSRAARS